LLRLRSKLTQLGLKLRDTPEADHKLIELRAMYEPYVYALANHLSQTLPPWIPVKKGKDNWQTTAWGRTAGMLASEGETVFRDDHF